jgi:hypothetical protein
MVPVPQFGMRRSRLCSSSGYGAPPVRPCAVHAQYIRIQAACLLSSPDPQVREAGRGPLQRVFTSFPDYASAKAAMEQLSGSPADEGRLAKAEQALRQTLRMLRRTRQAGPARPELPSSAWPK